MKKLSQILPQLTEILSTQHNVEELRVRVRFKPEIQIYDERDGETVVIVANEADANDIIEELKKMYRKDDMAP